MAAIELRHTSLFNDPALKAYYQLESNFSDSSPSGYNLTAIGTPGDIAAKFNNGKSFIYGSTYAKIADASCPSLEIPGSITVSVWAKPTNLGAFYSYIISKRTSSPSDAGYYLAIDNNSKPIFFAGGLATNNLVVAAAAVANNNLYHLVGVYDQSAGKLRIYINGSLSAEVTASGSIADGNKDFFIALNSNNASEGLDGILDDIAIFNRALSTQEISDLYNGNLAGASSPSASVSPSSSISSSVSPSSSISRSVSPSSSKSPSASISASASVSPSLSPSSSLSSSISPSPSQGYSQFSRDSRVSLPTDTNDLAISYTQQEETLVEKRDDTYVVQDGAGAFMIHQFKLFVGSAPICQVEYEGKSTLPPSLSPVYLQLYNYSTNSWQTVDSNGTAEADEDFELEEKVQNTTNYRDNDNVVTCRIYQQAI